VQLTTSSIGVSGRALMFNLLWFTYIGFQLVVLASYLPIYTVREALRVFLVQNYEKFRSWHRHNSQYPPALWFNLIVGWYYVRLAVSKPGFDSLAESYQRTLKVGIHSFPAWRSAFKKVSVEIGRQVRLLCPWARHLTDCLYLWVIKPVVTGGSFTRRPQRSLRCLLV